jgi:hypothetical protein
MCNRTTPISNTTTAIVMMSHHRLFFGAEPGGGAGALSGFAGFGVSSDMHSFLLTDQGR